MLGFERVICISRRPKRIKWWRERRQHLFGGQFEDLRGQFTLSTQLIKPDFYVSLSHQLVQYHSFFSFWEIDSLLKNFYYIVTIIITTLPIWSCLEPCTCVTWLDLSKMTGSIWPAVLPAMGRFSFALSTLSPLKTENKRPTLSS